MPTLRDILDTLDRNALIALVDQHRVAVVDRRVRAQLLDALCAAPVAPAELLASWSRDTLKHACRALGLDDGGREKSALVERLLATAPLPVQPSLPHTAPQAVAQTKPDTAATPAAPTETAAPTRFTSFAELSAFIFNVADILRGAYKPHEYGAVMLPMTLLRRFECVVAPHRAAIDAAVKNARGLKGPSLEAAVLDEMASRKLRVVHIGERSFSSVLTGEVCDEMLAYFGEWSANVIKVLANFKFAEQVKRLQEVGKLYGVVSSFAAIDLSPEVVDNHMMGMAFEDLIRRFAETSNFTAGEHYTPRDVIELMVDLLLEADAERLKHGAPSVKLYDPACGTGGMLTVAAEHIRKANPNARPLLYGQEINAESFALCQGDVLLRDQDPENIALGNTLRVDRHADKPFDYLLSNPPFGVDWKDDAKEVLRERKEHGARGRFAAGLPRLSDGSLLFLQHMVSKLRPKEQGGGRIAIVLNGSPLFTGDAGSGESDIRKWLFENDLVEAIVGLPDQLFFNTGIATWVWLVTNRKPEARANQVQIVDATGMGIKMRRSLGNKRNEIPAAQREAIVALYRDFTEGPTVKILPTTAFGYRKITVERPLRLRPVRDADHRARLDAHGAVRALTEKRGLGAEKQREGIAAQTALHEVVEALDDARTFATWMDFEETVAVAFKAKGHKLTGALRWALRDSLGERDSAATPLRDEDGALVPDPELRDNENVPLDETVEDYMAREVLPHVPDAWVDPAKDKIGYEVSITRYFYRYTPPRPPSEIAAEIQTLEREVQALLAEVFA